MGRQSKLEEQRLVEACAKRRLEEEARLKEHVIPETKTDNSMDMDSEEDESMNEQKEVKVDVEKNDDTKNIENSKEQDMKEDKDDELEILRKEEMEK